jgi:2-phosphosulfolactate phosphatase
MGQELDHFKHKVHVLFKREDLDHERLEGKVAIVLDVLFATTTIIHALHSGAKEVVPVLDEESARDIAATRNSTTTVLAGELYGDTIPGFFHPAPMRLAQEDLNDKSLVYSTTNGTVALRQALGADQIFVGAMINAASVVDYVVSNYPDKTILIVCSGSMGSPNLEDTCGAGYFIDLLKTRAGYSGKDTFSDAAETAQSVFKSEPSAESLLRSRVGRMMVERGMEEEVRFAANQSTHQIIPKVFGDVIKVV